MWSVIPFFTSLLLLIGFAGFRTWEYRTGKMVFRETRKSLDTKVSKVYQMLVTGNMPTEWRATSVMVLHRVTHAGILLLVRTLRAVERPLARLSYRMRTRVPSANGQDVSPFLKTITPEKKSVGEKTSDTI